MNIAGAFWAPFDSPDPEADVRAQADAWMEAEPNVLSHRIVAVRRPIADRPHWYEVQIEAEMRRRDEPLTLGLA